MCGGCVAGRWEEQFENWRDSLPGWSEPEPEPERSPTTEPTVTTEPVRPPRPYRNGSRLPGLSDYCDEIVIPIEQASAAR